MSKRTCSSAGCGERHYAKGMCLKHYRESRKAKKAAPEPGFCSVDGCDRKYLASGYCSAHWQRVKKHGDPQAHIPIRVKSLDGVCSVEGCNRDVFGYGLCSAHRKRLKVHGDVLAGIPLRGARSSCSVDGCERLSSARGLCSSHYARVKRSGSIGGAAIEKRVPSTQRDGLGRKMCRTCEVWLPEESFAKGKSLDGLNGECRECAVNRSRALLYGTTLDAIRDMFEKQNGKCFICGQHDGSLHVDHDHRCCPQTPTCGNCTRMMLCSSCNLGLGKLRDDPDLLLRAAEYIRSYRV